MSEIFIKLVNMSITASIIALVVLLFRAIFKKMPKFVSVILWGLVAVRLILPISFESAISLLPSGEPIPQDIIYTTTPQINTNLPLIDDALDEVLLDNFAPDETHSVNPMQIVVIIAGTVWILGVFAMLLYTLFSSLSIRKRVAEAMRLQGNVYIVDYIPTPFIFGIICPKIYIPSCIDDEDLECVIAHERAHISRFDHLWKPLAFLLLTIYWFNPILWIAYVIFTRDIELATDERVIKQKGEEMKKQYSNALINCSAERKFITRCPLAFGENAVKGRVRNVLNYKKPAFWVLIVALVSCILFGVFFLTNPKREEYPMPEAPADGEVFLDGVVVSVDGRKMTVQSFVFSLDAKEEGIYEVPLDVEREIPLPELKAGTKVRIVYDGNATEGNPHVIDRAFAIYAFNDDSPEPNDLSEFEYRNNYYGGKTIVKYIGDDSSVVIPSVIDGKAVTEIAGSAFKTNINLKSVYIPDTVQRISSAAFEDCFHLESVRMSSSVAIIGNFAFSNCKELTEITLPETLLQIGNKAFQKCYRLEYIKLPSSITSWGKNCFYDCAVKEVYVSDGLESIGELAFAECIKLEKVRLPDKIKLDSAAFFQCSRLETINVSENVTFGNNVFEGCNRLPDELKDK